MRGLVPGLPNPVPLLTRLPAILQEEEFVDPSRPPFLPRFMPAFDDAIAPVYSVLDNLEAYVRPEYAPSDFLEWLAGWVNVAVDEAWTEEQRRRIVADAASLHRRAGTAGGIRDALQLAAGPAPTVEVEETGGSSWSSTPGASLPGSADVAVVITITVPDGDQAELTRRFERVAAAVVPAHVPTRVEVSVTT
ncbi:phage tail protein [Agromyces sp. H66]|uniref:phage tail protein n=1 Tax=Agromyces sp. H66 TaxID=2529859 RepID=UPI0010AADD75|nr:phage tail protein [Agromyces sp. H66]